MPDAQPLHGEILPLRQQKHRQGWAVLSTDGEELTGESTASGDDRPLPHDEATDVVVPGYLVVEDDGERREPALARSDDVALDGGVIVEGSATLPALSWR
jgi:hypothetical protein